MTNSEANLNRKLNEFFALPPEAKGSKRSKLDEMDTDVSDILDESGNIFGFFLIAWLIARNIVPSFGRALDAA